MLEASNYQTTAVITGASSGLGYEFALQLAENPKLHLVLAARRRERLEKLAREIAVRRGSLPGAGEVTIVSCDLREQLERERLLEQVKALGMPVSWLINNAGYGSLGQFVDSPLATEAEMVQLNCVAPLHLTRALLPEMLDRNSGAIINVCSTAAYQPLPYMATYGATKAFLLSFSVALAAECRNSGVTVLAHCPGPTDTEFHLVAGLKDKLSFLPAVSAKQVVAQALAAAAGGRRIYINGFSNRLLAQLNRLIPKTLAARMIERILRSSAEH